MRKNIYRDKQVMNILSITHFIIDRSAIVQCPSFLSSCSFIALTREDMLNYR